MYFSMGENWGILSIVQNSGQTGSAVLQSDGSLAWYLQGQNAPSTSNIGLRLYSDVPATGNVLAQRNSTAAQTFRLYNTYTDGSNYERGVFDWTTTANTLTIGPQNAGTGSARNVQFVSASGNFNFSGTSGAISNIAIAGALSTTTSVYIGQLLQWGTASAVSGNVGLDGRSNKMAVFFDATTGSTGAGAEFIEMTAPSAPSANRVRFYAEDNGSGKTRLMALFATGAAQQVAIEP